MADFGIGLGVGLLSGWAAGGIAGKIAKDAGMNLAGLETAALRGGIAGAIGGAGMSAIYNGDVGKSAWQGFAAGLAASGVMWKMNDLRTTDFINNHAKLDPSYSPEQKANVIQSIKESGQSPVGGRLMSRFIRSGTVLNLASEASSPWGPGQGPHVTPGTNNMYFDGDPQNSSFGSHGTIGQFVANESWGPSFDGGTAFTHELGHTASGYSFGDPLNVAHSENLYRGWTGAPARNDYGVSSQGQFSQPVVNRSFWDGLTVAW